MKTFRNWFVHESSLSKQEKLYTFYQKGSLWLGMTGGFSTQVKVNVKPIGAFKSDVIRQVVFEHNII